MTLEDGDKRIMKEVIKITNIFNPNNNHDSYKSERLDNLNNLISGFGYESPERIVLSEFLSYLVDTEGRNIKGCFVNEGEYGSVDFGYPHRYSPAYIKGRYAKLYQLDEWYRKNQRLPMTFLTMTVRSKLPRKYEMNYPDIDLMKRIREGFESLQDGKRMLLLNLRDMGYKKRPYIMVYEPHPGKIDYGNAVSNKGIPHIHMILFASISDKDKDILRRKWEEWGYGSYDKGLDFDERPDDDNIKSLRNYLMKYMSKSFVDYSSKYQGCSWTKHEALFNAVAWKYRFRTWCASNELSKVMKYRPAEEDAFFYKTTLDDRVLWFDDEFRKQYIDAFLGL